MTENSAPDPELEQEGEDESDMELLLSRRRVRGVTCYLLRWQGHQSVNDECLREEELVHCRDKPDGRSMMPPSPVAVRVAGTPPPPPAAAPPPPPPLPATAQPLPAAAAPPPPPAAPPPVVASAGFRMQTRTPGPAEVATGPPYWAGRCCTTGPVLAGFAGRWSGVVGLVTQRFSHVVRYGRNSRLAARL